MAVQLGMLRCFPSSERLHGFPPYWLKVGVQESYRVVLSSEMGTVVLEDVDQGQGTQDVGGSWR